MIEALKTLEALAALGFGLLRLVELLPLPLYCPPLSGSPGPVPLEEDVVGT